MSASISQPLAQAEQHFRSGHIAQAERLLNDVLAADARNAKAAELLAYIHANRGEFDRAFGLLQIATASPDAPGEAHYYLGKLYLERNDFAAATASFQRAVARIGEFFEGLHDLGVALSGNGEPQAALDAYQRAQALNPNAAPLYYNKGVALDALKRFDAALAAYERAIALEANFIEAWANRGATLNDVGRYNEALACHEKVLALAPRHAGAWSNRGATLAALERFEEALHCHQQAVSLEPNFAEAWGRAGAVLNTLKQYARACEHFEKALALKRDLPYVRGDWLFARLYLSRWGASGEPQAIEQDFAQALAESDKGLAALTPFVSLALPATRAQLQHCAALFCCTNYPAPDNPRLAATNETRERLKLGYVSPDFRTHPVSFLSAGLFEQHDRARFEVHAISLQSAPGDPLAARIAAGVDHFHDFSKLADGPIAERVRALGIDIAIDLAGHTEGGRTGPFARRMAPIQVSYLGFPGSMGAPFIDYLFADEIVVPAAHRADYSEKIVYLPQCFQVNDDKRVIAAAPTRAQQGLSETALVFCCFNNSFKLNPRLFDLWLGLLRQIDHALLWLYSDNDEQQQNLRQWAAARGIAPERLIFAARLPYAEHLARYALADLVLDTLPFNGGTNTSDALWGGAPVLTCAGDTYAGRMAASLLHAVGLPELATQSLENYRDKALELARAPQKIIQLKQILTKNRATSTLFDTQRVTRHIEAAYQGMWQRYQNGLPPDHIHIDEATGFSRAD